MDQFAHTALFVLVGLASSAWLLMRSGQAVRVERAERRQAEERR